MPTRRQARKGATMPPETPTLDALEKTSPRVTTTGGKPEHGDHAKRQGRPQLEIKLGVRWSEIILAIRAGEYTWTQFCEGLDEQELARGQLRDSEGGFNGRPPTLVPREFHLACQREMRRRFDEIFSSSVLAVADQYVKLAQDPDIPAEKRAKMMQYAMERVFGAIPKDVRVSQEQPWEQMVLNVVTSDEDKGMPEHLSRRYASYAERQGEAQDDDRD